MSAEQEVRQAASALVEAFGRGDVDRYLGAFAPDASFLFHGTDRLLTSREEYRQEWATWVREDDFRVLGCSTSGTRVQVLGDTAVLTHAVRTTVATRAGREELRERETIVFARGTGGRWLAVHEHLSPDPGAAG
ncbi:YybH family protein [Geodermatophilus marinus]|uniref:YybH family protein n=1 Tax=Geodermatophilus sp. LHW52908 TaxID=2303986 RepID=UPI000E3C75C5|nr:SgcJ/EcaC family oxidoreductase [Geodermatophilus sp. LHW52908]RFU22224.1 SgcJ/EcaC family oxidoreductase [Geodermatophilus sp. LHW52908]